MTSWLVTPWRAEALLLLLAEATIIGLLLHMRLLVEGVVGP